MNSPSARPLGQPGLGRGYVASGGEMQTILVVEDEPLVRLHMCSALEEEGYIVLQAGRADAAISLLESNITVGVLITDVRLPGGCDGIQLAQEVGHRWPDVGIVVSSGLSDGDLEAPNGVTFLRKPFGVGALLKACNDAAAFPV